MDVAKPLTEWTEDDLNSLKQDEVPEGKTIEYKLKLPGGTNDDKKEFLADATSFANSSGGHLLFGIREEEGIPVEICGIPDVDPDAAKQRLENLLRNCVQPRMPGVYIHSIALAAGGHVFIVRVPRSWAQPHVVRVGGYWRFYSRNSAGKYPLDVPELRAQFLLSETVIERVREFRAGRLAAIVAGETPVRLDSGAKMVLHIVPFGASEPGSRLDLTLVERDASSVAAMGAGTTPQSRYNLDGLLVWNVTLDAATARSYRQVYRNGSIEATLGLPQPAEGTGGVMESQRYERFVIDELRCDLHLQQQLGVEPPLFVMLTLLGVKDCRVKPGWDYPLDWDLHARPIDRDTLLLDEVLVKEFAGDLDSVLRPAFDAIWNASGWGKCLNYRSDGTWGPD